MRYVEDIATLGMADAEEAGRADAEEGEEAFHEAWSLKHSSYADP